MFDRLRKTTRRVGMIGIGIASNIAYRWNFPVLEREMTAQSRQYLPDAKRKGIPALARTGERLLQPSADGVGDLFHRRYWIDVIGSEISAEAIMRHVQRNLNQFTPQEIATFRKTTGSAETLAVGDEFYIYVTGPWNAPVRVIDVTPTSFSFVTLEGHLEAGEITFRLLDHPVRPDLIRFEIISWSRSKDRLVRLAYEHIGFAKAAQTGMWTFFCQRVADYSGGQRVGKIRVETKKINTNA